MTSSNDPTAWRPLLDKLEDLADATATSVAFADALGGFFRTELSAKDAMLFSMESSPAVLAPVDDAGEDGDRLRSALRVSYQAKAPWQVTTYDDVTVHPLVVRDERVGLLALEFARDVDDGLLQFVLQRVARLLAQVRDRELVRDRDLELATIYEIDAIRDLHLEFNVMLQKIMTRMLELIPGDGAILSLVKMANEEEVFDRHQKARTGQEAALQSIIDHQQSDLDRVVRDAFDAKDLVHAAIIDDGQGQRAVLCMPLILDDEILGGFMLLSQRGRDFTPRDRRIFTAVCSQTDTAIFEDLKKRKLKDVFKRYVSRDVFTEMLKRDEDFLEGKRKAVTCFFSDLRGFTTVSEQLDVSVVVPMLNEHLEAMTDIVFEYGGTVDKFIGDCVMAFFGAPLDQEDHTERAVRAAVAMRDKHNEIAEGWAERGLPNVKIGIGVHAGEVFVGNIGGENLSSYTIIGDHVNLASRLEGVSGPDDIIISADVYNKLEASHLVEHVDAEERGELTAKGKTVPVRIYNVLNVK